MIYLDTNFLIHSLFLGTKESLLVDQWFDNGELLAINLIVWAEFLCGPATSAEILAARNLFPNPEKLEVIDAERAAELYNLTGRRRGSLADCMIAATCLREGSSLATQNLDHFRRFEPAGLKLIEY